MKSSLEWDGPQEFDHVSHSVASRRVETLVEPPKNFIIYNSPCSFSSITLLSLTGIGAAIRLTQLAGPQSKTLNFYG